MPRPFRKIASPDRKTPFSSIESAAALECLHKPLQLTRIVQDGSDVLTMKRINKTSTVSWFYQAWTITVTRIILKEKFQKLQNPKRVTILIEVQAEVSELGFSELTDHLTVHLVLTATYLTKEVGCSITAVLVHPIPNRRAWSSAKNHIAPKSHRQPEQQYWS